ncbi:LysR family transcriptional regulator [Bifidobacterium lemurum]|uniref:LysR family transcriptional regulator n=2 Tax=Bifidobacterium lemurum TaxID=1603886 RepID=A0A261FM83_9BIFI|nr:LysR family transcriptional regulator [Bifidobacterium lemurum]QOL35507.1 LysR family transcriptional regulator [Bifidobacterium lemurum]
MYDRRLDAVIASADLGSFGKAAERLHISVPALVKQVNTFEREHHLTLFHRSRGGVEPTIAGEQFVEDARAIIRQCDEIVRRARAAEMGGDMPVRLGVSVLRSGKRILDLWQHGAARHGGSRLEIVPMVDDYAAFENVVRHLGEHVDVVVCAFMPQWWGDVCGTLRIEDQPLAVAVPRDHPLALRRRLSVSDLEGNRVRVIARGHGGNEDARDALESNGGIEVVDFEHYDLSVFNDCVECGDLLLSKPVWSDVHPGLVTVPVDWDFTMQYGVMHALEPSAHVRRFLDEVTELAAWDMSR